MIHTKLYTSNIITRVYSTVTIRSDRVSGAYTLTDYRLAKQCAIATLKSAGYSPGEITGEQIFTIMSKQVSKAQFEKDVNTTNQRQKLQSVISRYLTMSKTNKNKKDDKNPTFMRKDGEEWVLEDANGNELKRSKNPNDLKQ